ncbi:MAG: NUDIX domain-containing protein [Clostridiales bacterium]|nr:NUDIX domain-containing protein [Clostridiales bacterium]
MKVLKAGCILLNKETKQIGLVYRPRREDYSFPKGHLEEGETLKECAIRETEEETGRKCHIISEEICKISFVNPIGEDVDNYFYLALDDGPSDKVILEELQEELVWKSLGEVEENLTYDNLKEVWNSAKMHVAKEIKDTISPAELTDMGICPTCFNKENGNGVYGDNSDKVVYEDEYIEAILVGNPRALGHTMIASKKHYKDIMEIPDDLCEYVFKFSKKIMNIIKQVYGSESVYLCTMCDGPMNHFHVQLIPRYSWEKRGSKNFVKERIEYVVDYEKITKIRELLNK